MEQFKSMTLTFINTLTMRYVDTGDRMFDNSLIALLTLSLSSIILYIFNNYKYIYNLFIYYVLKGHKTPTDFTKGRYCYEESEVISKSYISLMKRSNEFEEYLKKIIIKNANQAVLTSKRIYSNNMESIDDDSGYIPIYISAGSIIYAHYKYGDLNIYAPTINLINETIGYYINAIKNNSMSDITGQKLFNTSYNDNSRIKYIGPLSTKKTFNTLFYDDKEALLKILTKFKNKTMYPPNISMDNKLGILLYGPPGTGKTGTITAIANFLKRDVISINFSEITTCKQFDSVLSTANNKSNIIIFDEFDCILDALIDNSRVQKKVVEEPPKVNWGELLAAAQGEERTKILDMIRENKKSVPDEPINLAYLLSKLDGLESNDDRIIIATTNNPDKINPVLLRPGRFDLKLCLGNCSTKMYRDILTNFFELSEDAATMIDWDMLPEKKHSPLVVINTALKCQGIDRVLEELR